MKRYRLLLCLPILYLLSTGCSVIGLAIGVNTDTYNINYEEEEIEDSDFFKSEYPQIEKGNDLKIILINGRTLEVDFVEFKRLSLIEYSRKYAEMINVYGNEVFFPNLHDTIKVTYHNENTEYYEFLGFDTGCIQVGSWNKNIYKITPKNNYKLTLCNYDGELPYKMYEEMMSNGQIPYQSTIVIQVAGNVKQIPLDEVRHIIKIVPHKDNYALEGFLVGLGIDVLIISMWLSSDPFTFEMDFD